MPENKTPTENKQPTLRQLAPVCGEDEKTYVYVKLITAIGNTVLLIHKNEVIRFLSDQILDEPIAYIERSEYHLTIAIRLDNDKHPADKA